jgi:hypothetical protein
LLLGLLYRFVPKTRPALDIAGHAMFYVVGLPFLLALLVLAIYIEPVLGLVYGLIFIPGILITRALHSGKKAGNTQDQTQ